jgi:hypothetical protein
MRKISKRDQTPESIAAENAATMAWVERSEKSQHFMPGSFVTHSGERCEVVGSIGEVLLLRTPAGEIVNSMPMALSHSVRRDVAVEQLRW